MKFKYDGTFENSDVTITDADGDTLVVTAWKDGGVVFTVNDSSVSLEPKEARELLAKLTTELLKGPHRK